MDKTDSRLDELLDTWEGVYKKGLLSFWILMLLYKRPSYAFEMSSHIREISHDTISADDNSLYRALNRFEESGIVQSEAQPSPSGPARRVYRLSEMGQRLLAQFIQRNLMVFQEPEIAGQMNELMALNLKQEESHGRN